MRLARYSILFILIYLVSPTLGLGQVLTRLASVSVLNSNNNVSPLEFSQEKPVVILVLGADCPITQKYAPTMNDLNTLFSPGVTFIGLFPKQFSFAEVSAFVDEYRISFPCYIDHNMEVIGMLGSTVTPEAFLISPALEIRYAGAIDNWFYKLGSYRTKVTAHYLRDAIRSHSEGTEIKIRRTEAIGCPIPAHDKNTRNQHHSHH